MNPRLMRVLLRHGLSQAGDVLYPGFEPLQPFHEGTAVEWFDG